RAVALEDVVCDPGAGAAAHDHAGARVVVEIRGGNRPRPAADLDRSRLRAGNLDVDDRDVGVAHEDADPKRRGRVADDAEAAQLGAGDVRGDDRRFPFAGAAGEPDRGGARYAAAKAHVALQLHALAILAGLD